MGEEKGKGLNKVCNMSGHWKCCKNVETPLVIFKCTGIIKHSDEKLTRESKPQIPLCLDTSKLGET